MHAKGKARPKIHRLPYAHWSAIASKLLLVAQCFNNIMRYWSL